MRIVVTHDRFDVAGGAENLIASLAQGLRRRGHDVELATRRFDRALWEGAFDGVPVHLLDARAALVDSRGRRAYALARQLAERFPGADLVVANNHPSTAWASLGWPRGRRPRVIWYCHEPDARLHWRVTQATLLEAAAHPHRHRWAGESLRRHFRRLRWRRLRRTFVDRHVDRSAVSALDAILANSRFTAGLVERVYARSARVCLPGVPAPERPPAHAGEPYLACVTGVSPHKNALGLFEALRIAVHELGARDLRVRVLGLPERGFERHARRLDLLEQAHREPRLATGTLHALLGNARAVVYPSIDEPFGLVPIEAMALARPVVALDCGGPRESVVPGVTGLLAPPLDPRALATALLALWRDPARADAMGRAGRERHREHFELAAFLDRFERLAYPSPA